MSDRVEVVVFELEDKKGWSWWWCIVFWKEDWSKECGWLVLCLVGILYFMCRVS